MRFKKDSEGNLVKIEEKSKGFKTERDLKDKFASEIENWFNQRDVSFSRYYIYYKKSEKNSVGDLVIAKKQPSGYILATAEPLDISKTVDQNFNKFYTSVLRKLPVMTI